MAGNGYLLGFDVGSSSVKASLLDADTGRVRASATSPETEMAIYAQKPGWAEQDPLSWWEHAKRALAMIRSEARKEVAATRAIGISYQMHGLVLVDKNGEVLRPSIIWCDSRAVPYGNKAFKELGEKRCLSHLLNSPGNFTAAKLAWVKDQEPETYRKIHKFMLPGDFIAFKLSGEVVTTPSGVSEGILWDMLEEKPAAFLLDYFGFSPSLLPPLVDTFAVQGRVRAEVASELGLPAGIPVAYRAGDQPNNAFSLNVLEPGELATTAGTSGVVYGIASETSYDPLSRVNTFVHVNHRKDRKRLGVLMCLNGTGILNRWLKQNCADTAKGSFGYAELNDIAATVPAGSAGLSVLPFGNGAERTLENANPGASFHGLNFNMHTRAHLLRAGQEGIVFALNYGLDIMRSMGMKIETVKAGYANMFLSSLFRECFATVTGANVELYSTDGAQGAARGAGLGAGIYASASEAFTGLERKMQVEPSGREKEAYTEAYARWVSVLKRSIGAG